MTKYNLKSISESQFILYCAFTRILLDNSYIIIFHLDTSHFRNKDNKFDIYFESKLFFSLLLKYQMYTSFKYNIKSRLHICM